MDCARFHWAEHLEAPTRARLYIDCSMINIILSTLMVLSDTEIHLLLLSESTPVAVISDNEDTNFLS